MGCKTYPIEFKREANCLVIDKGFTLAAAHKMMVVGQTAMRAGRQLKEECGGKTQPPERSGVLI